MTELPREDAAGGRRIQAGALVALGLLGVCADLFGVRGGVRLASASGVSPMPGGPRTVQRPAEVEPSTLPSATGTRLFLEFADGRPPLELDARRLQGLGGPPQRRALYRLALTRGPRLDADLDSRPFLRALLAHAFERASAVRAELELDPDAPLAALQWQPASASDAGAPYRIALGGTEGSR